MAYSTAVQGTAIKAQVGRSIERKEYPRSEAKLLIAVAGERLEALCSGNKALLFGNSGSAADA
jgi:phosphoheptose isomerase